MMSTTRRQARRLAREESEVRTWATVTARSLALALYQGHELAAKPYTVGVILRDGEVPWAEFPARCTADQVVVPTTPRKGDPPPLAPVATWLATDRRVAGRINGSVLRWWEWGALIGCQADLSPGRERVQLDPNGVPPVIWWGPGVAPLAVAAVYHLHGAEAVVEHPGLAVLREDPAAQLRRKRRGSNADLGPVVPRVPAGELGMPPLRDWWL